MGWRRFAAVAVSAAVLVTMVPALAQVTVASAASEAPPGTPQAYADEVLADDPVSWWPLTETSGSAAADVQGLNNGLIQGGVTTGTDGPFASSVPSNTGMSFDGRPCSGIDVSRNPSSLARTVFALETWVRTTNEQRGVVFRWRHHGYSMSVGASGTASFGINTSSGGSASAAGGPVVNDGEWHHVVAARDAASIRLYVDGVLVDDRPGTSGGYFTGEHRVAIGRDASACDGVVPSFKGDIAQVAYYPAALTDDRVLAHYCAGVPTGDGCGPVVAVDAGPDQTVPEGSTVTLAGSASGSALATGNLVSSPLVVGAQANIYGAGHAAPPGPRGGGAGILPTAVDVELVPGGHVTVDEISGTVRANGGWALHGPDGDHREGSDLHPYGGISGIRSFEGGNHNMFMVGVFLGDEEPADPAPPLLDFAGNLDFDELAPALHQQFFMGDGRTSAGEVQRFVVPEGATRLYLGFADSLHFTGPPGYYHDNSGALDVSIRSHGLSSPVSYEWTQVSSEGPPVQLSSSRVLRPSFDAIDDGRYVFQLAVSNGFESATDQVEVVVENVAPTITRISADPSATDGLAETTVVVSDPGVIDTQTVAFDWGDGSEADGRSAAIAGTGWAYAFAGHRYSVNGSQTVTASVTDDDGGTSAPASTDVELGAAGSGEPIPGAALWVDGTDAAAIDITGSGNALLGYVHSNGGINLGGSGHVLSGGTEAAGPVVSNGDGHAIEPAAVTVPPSPLPEAFVIADYRAGGRAAVAAGEVGMFFDVPTAECGQGSWRPKKPLATGLYHVPCAVHISRADIAGRITIVAEGDVVVSGAKFEMEPFTDGLLFASSSTGARAIDLAGSGNHLVGAMFAPAGGIEITGSSNALDCGIFARAARISGHSNVIAGPACAAGVGGGDPVPIAAPPILVPDLSLEFTADASEVAPGATIAYTATVTNGGSAAEGAPGTWVLVPVQLGIDNRGATPVTVDTLEYSLEVHDPATNAWETIASSAAVPGVADATILTDPDPTAGVTYVDGVLGTEVGARAFASWAGVAAIRLDAALVARLLDPARVDAIRNQVDLDTTGFFVRRIARFDDDPLAGLRVAPGGDLVDASVRVLSLSGAQDDDASSLPALSALAPGASATAVSTVVAPVPLGRSAGETDADYLARLAAYDGAPIIATATSRATGSVGTMFSGLRAAVVTQAVPVVALELSTPPTVQSGTDAIWTARLTNSGSAPAVGLELDLDLVGIGPLATTALPPVIEPGATVEVTARYSVPEDFVSSLTARASFSWAQSGGPERYGPIGREATSAARPALAVNATKSYSSGTNTPSGQVEFDIDVRNDGATTLTDVVIADHMEPNLSIVAGTVEVTGTGALLSGNAPGEDSLVVSVGSLPTGGFTHVHFRADFSGAAAGTTSVVNQATITSNELPPVLTDDPSVSGVEDPTVVLVSVGGGGGSGGGAGGSSPGTAAVEDLVPVDGGSITVPTDVQVGSVSAGSNETIASWQLLLRPAGAPLTDDHELARGAGDPSGSTLGTIDPTIRDNGIWLLRLEVTDVDGAVTYAETSVVIDGGLKLGRFTVTYQDLLVPIGGLPIQVLRTYDSLDRATSGDFGHGWNVDIADVSIRANRPLGTGGWTSQSCGGGLIFVPVCFTADGARYVTVSWPDGRTESFDFTPTGNTFFRIMMVPAYTPRPGVTSTLTAVGGAGGLGADGHMHTGGFGDGAVYDPQQWLLTTKDGTEYLLDRDLGLVSMTDRAGNTVTVDDDGIRSSLGPEIRFDRDPRGRIATITDPADKTITYAYDPAGDLAGVTDQNGNTTTYGYTGDHHLDLIDDPGPGPFQTMTYGPDGRIETITDANGDTVEVDFGLEDRTELVKSSDGKLTTATSYDERGNALVVDEIFDGVSHRNVFTYNDDDKVTSRTDPLLNTWAAVYDADENLLHYEDAEGNETVFTYDEFGYPTSVRDPALEVTTFEYFPTGRLRRVVDARDGVTEFAYDDQGNQTSRTDPLERTHTWTYTPEGRVETSKDPVNPPTEYTYDDAGRVETITNGEDETTSYGYDDVGNLTSITDPLDRTTRYGYDGRNLLTAVTDPALKTTAYGYDDLGQLTSVINATLRATTYTYAHQRLASETIGGDETTTFAYDSAGRLAAVTDPLDRTTRYGYDLAGRRTSVTRPVGDGDTATTTTAYDGNGRPTVTTNAEDEATVTAYDPLGRVAAITDGLNRTTTFGYGPTGLRTTVTNGENETTTWTHDLAGQLIAITNAADETTAYDYDDAGNLVTVADPLSRTTTYGYDAANRRVSVTDPGTTVATTVYDDAGQLVETVSAAGTTMTFGYDPRGLLATATDELGNTTTSTYDDAGRLATEIDQRNNTTRYGYDAAGRLETITDPLHGVVAFGYDDAGQRVSVTDPNSRTRTFGFDDGGRLVREIDELDRATLHGYDAADRRITTTDPRGATIGFEYDDAGQLVAETSADGDEELEYDGAGRVVRATAPTGVTSYVYDLAGRTIEVATPAGTVGYGYDDAGQRTTMVQPQRTVSYGYDPRGHLDTIDDPGGRIDVGFDEDGKLVWASRPNGVTTEQGYDLAGRLTDITHTGPGGIIEAFVYTLDPAGNRTAVTSQAGTEGYTLDANNRLTDVSYPDSTTEAFGYDAAGNRTEHTDRTGTTTTYTIDEAGQVVDDSSGTTYTYDAAGNLTATSDGDSFTYDRRGRMVAASADGASQTYGYDADDRRVAVDGTTQLWDTAGGVPTLIADGPDAYTHTPAGITTGDGRHLLQDAVGSVRATTDASGAVAGRAEYTAFGESLGGTTRLFGYAGEQTDPTGLIHLRARQYDPTAGRFTSTDPVQPGGRGTAGWNHYSYAANNPSTWADPSGQLVDYSATLSNSTKVTPVAAAAGVAVRRVLVQAAVTLARDCVLDVLLSGTHSILPSLGTSLCERPATDEDPHPDSAQGPAPRPPAPEPNTNDENCGTAGPSRGPRCDAVVIGESTKRTSSAATAFGARFWAGIEGDALTYEVVCRANEAWLRGELERGTHVIDIGIDSSRRGSRSPYYQLERRIIAEAGYPVESRPWPASPNDYEPVYEGPCP